MSLKLFGDRYLGLKHPTGSSGEWERGKGGRSWCRVDKEWLDLYEWLTELPGEGLWWCWMRGRDRLYEGQDVPEKDSYVVEMFQKTPQHDKWRSPKVWLVRLDTPLTS